MGKLQNEKLTFKFRFKLQAILLFVVIVAFLITPVWKYFQLRKVDAQMRELDAQISDIEKLGGELFYGGTQKSEYLDDTFGWLFGFKTFKPISIKYLPVQYLQQKPKEFQNVSTELVQLEVTGVVRSRDVLRIMPENLRSADLHISQNLLAEFSRFQNLERLGLRIDPPITGNVPRMVNSDFETPAFSNKLERLHLKGLGVTDEVIEMFRNIPSLRVLSIEGDNVLGSGLAKWERASKVESLLLSGGFDDDAMLLFPAFPELKSANIISHSLHGEGLEWISSSEKLSSVRFSGSNLQDIALQKISKLSELQEIRIDGSQIDGTGFAHLANLKQLRTIKLSRSPVDKHGLMKLQMIANLEKLYLDSTNITPDSIRYFEQFPSLKHLEIKGLQVRDDDLVSFASPPSLRSFWLYGSEVSPEGVRQFNERNPTVQLRIHELFRDRLKALRGF